MNHKKLKPEYQELADEFTLHYEDRGCSCFLHPPCSHCTHEGNPICLEENEAAWENRVESAMRVE